MPKANIAFDPNLVRKKIEFKEEDEENRYVLTALIKSLRKAAGLTQAEAGKVMGVDRTSVTNMESGYQVVTIERLIRLADFLDLEVNIAITPKPKETQHEI